ncbi:MAG: DUF3126 family protein [Janthinobacterium lividum]|jgi:hypothetical protein
MTPSDIARVETYLRRTMGNPKISITPPKRKGATVEVMLDGEFMGTLHRDEEDGEVSYALHITILDEDLPPPPKK